MLDIIFIRHAPTPWNEKKRLQGLTDIPLSPKGRAWLGSWQVPSSWHARVWFASPLQRARETARLLGLDFRIEPLLRETAWGEWEGKTLDELRHSAPLEMERREGLGLDLTPPGGESPRQVQQRLQQWADQLMKTGIEKAGAVCHKGVMRAVFAQACGWNMLGKPPCKLDFQKPQGFGWDGENWHLLETDIRIF